ncbi:hypothetical protein JW905_04425 [bacterium]|nr:hypothetical protein [candidate division CSSED10-310 bacterium]
MTRLSFVIVTGALGLLPIVAGASATLHVPAGYATIQAAIDAANEGDVISVAPGTYQEEIDFHGKNIMVRAAQGPAVTHLRGDDDGIVVSFVSGESSAAVLDGFTISHGYGGYGGAVQCDGASPLIRGNVIECNGSVYKGSGIAMLNGSHACIEHNCIRGNYAEWKGAAISSNDSEPIIKNNLIIDNYSEYQGGALYGRNSLFTLQNNTIAANHSGSRGGAGLFGIDCGLVAANNIIADNTGGPDSGQGIYLEGTVSTYETACNDFWNNQGGPCGGEAIPGATDLNVDPRFAPGPNGNHYLKHDAAGNPLSPCVDAGSCTSADLELDEYCTRFDLLPDAGIIDLGFHYPQPEHLDSTWLMVVLNQEQYYPDDPFTMIALLNNPGTALDGTVAVVLQAMDTYFFWPDWTETVFLPAIALPPAARFGAELLSFQWPTGVGTGEMIIWSALFNGDPLTDNLLSIHDHSFTYTD